MEFWDGWSTTGEGRTTPRGVEEAAADLDTLLASGASVNVYMFHGGTNFGLTSEANDKGVYRPTVTSYDCDAPLDEASNPTPKYHAFREVISRYAPVPAAPASTAAPAPEYCLALGEPVRLLANPGSGGVWSDHESMPSSMSWRPGWLFRTDIDVEGAALLTVGEVRDRATVFLDGDPVGVLDRERQDRAIMLPRGRGRLEIVFED
jgi:beta-galactosidase